MPHLSANRFRQQIDATYLQDETAAVNSLVETAKLSPQDRADIAAAGADLVSRIRAASDPGLMEVFLAEYGLSTDEGIALMCLAEALLRVPDADTIDALIDDKIAPSNWGTHLGKSASSLVNASTWALMLTGRVLEDDRGMAQPLRRAIKRLGEPVIRTAVARAMREMGRQFVLGVDINAAMKRAAGMEAQGFTYSYDMLGEAARTDEDAKHYHLAYSRAISSIAVACTHGTVAENPGISVKLSALHPRYEEAQRDRVMAELVPRLRSLAMLAKSAGQGFNVDAEEADRLSLSLDVIEAVVSDPALAGWDGFGVVVQAFGQRAGHVIDRLADLAQRTDRKLMVRLVKGAYWDAEIKRAQVMGLDGFPVFTSKNHTDVSYISNARKLLTLTDHIYPQFATHNAHTVSAILHMARDTPKDTFEFQRLHGMGETLHKIVLKDNDTRCRIYAPVGAHEDLLAYLVRRLLENGANSSFVNQIVDETVPPVVVAADPFEGIGNTPDLPKGPQLFRPHRANSRGWDITHQPTLDAIEVGRKPFETHQWRAAPLTSSDPSSSTPHPVRNPAKPDDIVGHITWASIDDAQFAMGAATPWNIPVKDRATVLRAIAKSYEDNANELFGLLHREAGKTMLDCVGELREAVDFLYYYAAEAEERGPTPRGIWACISPWNFPLAIFTGQIAAALAAGNGVLAKPAEQTGLIAHRAVQLMHSAGVPTEVLHLLPGGGDIGAAVTADARLGGVAFTGSTATALKIRAAMADTCKPGTPLIAETGGLNAMIVDSTALPEHAVRDILQSAFQSAGQRCSALRCLYVQEDVADKVLHMLKGAMDELRMGDPWMLSTDVGPVIDEAARKTIQDHIDVADAEGRVLHALPTPGDGTFVAPTVIKVDSIADLKREIFGPVLHVATYKARDLNKVIEDINATGYGLTFGLHTRIDDRVEQVLDQVDAGNIYVNRNQIGAVVGSQPFGGEGLSGTGPKAGGPMYMPRFAEHVDAPTPPAAPVDLPGPTGESNRLSSHPRGPILCLGPDRQAQADQVLDLGGIPMLLNDTAPDLAHVNCAAVVWNGDDASARVFEQALAKRTGPIVPLITGALDAGHVLHERHICVDTTAAGGNAALLAEVGA
ncbi:bifunctional proline dehydrogenase/L-glutamate gamma-semialdehyde dehydrogenase PutA [Octadecabacter sp. 1_MG-2023]|uniref:bifunctional proline dehydrogenase/L-glutamate gamma-semialdehyde dehydrogenase PutA n=1 Tax=unclassified Octadecabacter TaxID=196158 RepID=UPI001C09E5EC|nr:MULTISPECIES: bifunctional proline dehydrogenase/L-glutamate gamma-semialdehyde dehydrogenase PutA [unclassified Octadecabacter]MBU2992671.1 bifunctional proline dehydrogenase/L-glutamate gamma-semialdehyde dehydrogenase PutA [Octadecabacter sp. B2R22]MDO6733878.1 bifunctional proline dehydrogenase/L-glutamate gamma-semialdehyde dehydrogenase PutA [Octadecabacter sp. 1_MG-2023]